MNKMNFITILRSYFLLDYANYRRKCHVVEYLAIFHKYQKSIYKNLCDDVAISQLILKHGYYSDITATSLQQYLPSIQACLFWESINSE